jgi:segregation and condensation protein A
VQDALQRADPSRDGPPRDDAAEPDALLVDVDGFEGPLDLLLQLARTQKVDLRRISVLHLARQYLGFVERARALRIELAADYLVMAAWLAYLKSRLLLPPGPEEEGPSADEMAARLAFRLKRLEAMRGAAGKLMERDLLGRDRFARGAPEVQSVRRETRWEASLLDVLQAYARLRTRDEFRPYALEREGVMTLEDALERLRPLIGDAGDWADLMSFLPQDWSTPERRRAATAATFVAALELARHGVAELRQDATFAPIRVRRR